MKEVKGELIVVKNKIFNKLKKICDVFFKEDIEKENRFFIVITLIIYTFIIGISCFYHECWQDEAQAWLIARDLSPIGIIKQMRFEGHSCLWHFILLPFAKLGLPFDTIKIIPIIAAIITGYLILAKSQFNRLTKISILFSSTFLYYMPAIARPYSLMPLLVTILSIMNKEKEKYPISYGVVLALLANTHILMLPLAGMLFLYNYGIRFFLDRKKWTSEEKKKVYFGMGIAIIGMIIIAVFAVSGYFCSFVGQTEKINTVLENLRILTSKCIYFFVGVEYLLHFKIMLIIIISLLLLLLLHSIWFSRNQGTIFFVTLISFILIYLLVYEHLLNQRAGMLFLFMYYYAWNYRFDLRPEVNNSKIKLILSKLPTIILLIMFAFSIRNTYRIIDDEIKKPYAGGKEMAQYIENNIEEDSVFLCLNPELMSPIIAYVGEKDYIFYEFDSGIEFTYKTWDKFYKYKKKNLEKAIQKFEGKEQYILLKTEIESLDEYLKRVPGIKEISELVYQTESCSGGIFHLLKVN